MGERGSLRTMPVTVSEVSCGRWSAWAKTSAGTSLMYTTHCMMPVPSRTSRKCSFPDERLLYSQPLRVTCLPSKATMSLAMSSM